VLQSCVRRRRAKDAIRKKRSAARDVACLRENNQSLRTELDDTRAKLSRSEADKEKALRQMEEMRESYEKKIREYIEQLAARDEEIEVLKEKLATAEANIGTASSSADMIDFRDPSMTTPAGKRPTGKTLASASSNSEDTDDGWRRGRLRPINVNTGGPVSQPR
jgi:hypothetical protein